MKRETLVIMRLDDGKQESGNLEIVKVYIGDAIFLALLPLLKLVSAFTAISLGGRPMQEQQASAGEFWAQSLAMVGPRVGKKRMKLGKQATRLVYYFSCTLHLEDPDKGAKNYSRLFLAQCRNTRTVNQCPASWRSPI